MIVMKFGGTSVKDEAAMDRASAIVAERIDQAPLVVLSAMSGVTSSLLEMSRLVSDGQLDEALRVYEKICVQHLDILPDLRPDLDQLREVVTRAGSGDGLTPAGEDEIASFGERLSSQIFASRLSRLVRVTHVDSRQCLITDERFTRALPDVGETTKRLDRLVRPLIENGSAVVMAGYIGSTKSGQTSTLGRGGSDYSATLFGSCLGAEEVQIWTDVDGMMTADPRVVPEASTIRHISFDEAAELAYFGAKVLHPLTLMPAIQKGVPVHVLNSARPEGGGTVITSDAPACDIPVKSLACKRGITALTITSSRMLMAHGFLKALFEVFDKHQTSVDVVTTSEVSVSLTTDDRSSLDAVLADLEAFGTVQVEDGLAIVCLVGANLKDRPGIASMAFGCLDDVNVRMISQGASNINLTFVVGEDLVDTVVRRLHHTFFKEFDPDIFEPVP
jgi:aspartate kinase